MFIPFAKLIAFICGKYTERKKRLKVNNYRINGSISDSLGQRLMMGSLSTKIDISIKVSCSIR